MSPPGCYPDFRPDLQAWRAAGIFSAFASGNEGPGPETILSPGNYAEAFAVGATDPEDLVADFSGEGPSQCDGAIKPDIAAPGVAVFSSLPGDFWLELDGTSMATPHVTGAAAVLLSIDNTLGIDDLESALSLGAADVEDPGVDNLTGAGRLDVLGSASI
jgi:subtilisin family serine protease